MTDSKKMLLCDLRAENILFKVEETVDVSFFFFFFFFLFSTFVHNKT